MVESRIRGAKFCGDASEVGNERWLEVSWKFTIQCEKSHEKHQNPKLTSKKLLSFLFLFSPAVWWPGVIDLLVTWRLERVEGLQYWINHSLYAMEAIGNRIICDLFGGSVILSCTSDSLEGPTKHLVCSQERFGTVLCGQLGSSLRSCSALRSGPSQGQDRHLWSLKGIATL